MSVDDCPICLHALRGVCVSLPCGHVFHGECMDCVAPRVCAVCRAHVGSVRTASERAVAADGYRAFVKPRPAKRDAGLPFDARWPVLAAVTRALPAGTRTGAGTQNYMFVLDISCECHVQVSRASVTCKCHVQVQVCKCNLTRPRPGA
jgi:hypothetical protein